MPFNVDKKSVEKALDMGIQSPEDSPLGRTFRLLKCALLSPLCKQLANQNAPHNLEPYNDDTFPRNADRWLTEAFNNGQTIYRCRPDEQMAHDIYHVFDWIRAAIMNDEPWLQNVDEHGNPRKLNKIGSLEQAVREADKAMLIYAQKATASMYQDAEGHEKTIKTFDNGYRIVQLLSTEALDKESAYLGHCVGNGSYDGRLNASTHAFYSLRDTKGKGHATLEVQLKDNALLQCKGKQNRPPVSKYMPHIQKFLKEQKFKLTEAPGNTGLLEQDGIYYDVFNLPEDFEYHGDMFLTGTQNITLPHTLTVDGFLFLSCTKISALPENLTVGKSLDLESSSLTALPENLSIGGYLNLLNTAITELPADLHVEGNIYLPNGTMCESVSDARAALARLHPAPPTSGPRP